MTFATPGHAAITIENGLNHDHSVQPGGVYQGVIVVRNQGLEPTKVRHYKTDYLFFADGTAEYGEPGSVPRSNSAWIAVWPAQITLGPREKKTFHYAITVPRDEHLRGAYWSMIMVEETAEESTHSSSSSGQDRGVEAQIKTKTRFGLQIASHLQDRGDVQVNFSALRIEQRQGRNHLLVDLENQGQAMVRGELAVELYRFDGAPAGTLRAKRLRTYPGTSVRYPIELHGVAPGKYKALAVLRPLLGDLYATEFQLDIR